VEILDKLRHDPDPASQARLIRMHGRHEVTFSQIQNDSEWKKITHEIVSLDIEPELGLGDDAV
jgi:hypothetical protein